MKIQIIPLGDVCEVFNGKTPSRAEQRIQGFPILKIKDVDEFGLFRGQYASFVDEEFYKSHSDKKVHENDILILNAAHNSDYVGSKKFIASKEINGTIATGEWLIIRSDDKCINPQYLFYWLASEFGKQSLKAIVRGIHLYPKDVKKLRIPLIEIQLQNKVVEDIKNVETIFNKRKLSIKKLDELIQSIFYDMFGDPLVKKSEFELTELSNLVVKNGLVDGPFGSSVNTKVDYIENGEIPVIRTKNVGTLEFIETDLKFMRREKYLSLIRSQVLPGDIVLTKVGTIGNLCIFPNTHSEAVLSTTGSCRIRTNEEVVNPLYLVHCLNLQKPILKSIAAEGVQAFLNLKHIRTHKVPLPPIHSQNKFASIASSIQEKKTLYEKSNQQLENLFQSLLNQAFSIKTTQYAN